jgi:hypothetical protein
MGQIGRRKPKVQSRDEYARPRDERDMVPFDDPFAGDSSPASAVTLRANHPAPGLAPLAWPRS